MNVGSKFAHSYKCVVDTIIGPYRLIINGSTLGNNSFRHFVRNHIWPPLYTGRPYWSCPPYILADFHYIGVYYQVFAG